VSFEYNLTVTLSENLTEFFFFPLCVFFNELFNARFVFKTIIFFVGARVGLGAGGLGVSGGIGLYLEGGLGFGFGFGLGRVGLGVGGMGLGVVRIFLVVVGAKGRDDICIKYIIYTYRWI